MAIENHTFSTDNGYSKLICNQNALLIAAIDAEAIEEVKKLLKENGELTSEIVNLPCGRLRVTALEIASTKEKHGAELVKLLLAYGAKADVADKLGRTPLRNAALADNQEAVKALLTAGAQVDCRFQINSWPRQQSNTNLDSDNTVDAQCADINAGYLLPVPECWGRTPLHQAVKSGSPGCVSLLLEAGAKVNAEDEKGTTPLLLAGSGITPENKFKVRNYEEIVELLVKAKAEVNIQNDLTKMTPLHHAIMLHSLRSIQCLLDAGANLHNESKENVRTVLHEAASTGSDTIIQLLLHHGASTLVNLRDKHGRTPLHIAAHIGARGCLAKLLIHGGNLAAQNNLNISVMDTIFSHIPRPVHFLTEILNESIIPNSSSVNDRDFKVTLDFGVLCPLGIEQQMEVVTALMASGSDFQQMRIVQHPLLETFLRFKWQCLRIFFIMLLVVHICFVASLSTYCLFLVYHNNTPILEVIVSRRVLLVSVLVLFSHSFIQILMLPRHYLFQYETWVNATCMILSLAIGIAGEVGNMTPFLVNRKPTGSMWVLHIMSFAVLLAWAELMLLMGRFPTWGYYALMFFKVLQNVLKVLLTFGGLLIGFAFSFTVQFHEVGQFKQIWLSLVKTTVMMMGEFEYEQLFPERDEMTPLRLNVTSRIIFLTFVVLSAIVLMNLMVGLAVSDIQELQTVGHVQRLLKQAEFVAHLEKLTTHRMLKSTLFPLFLHRFLDKRRSIDTKVVIQPSEISSGGKGLSYTLLEAIVNVAIQNQRKTQRMAMRYSNEIYKDNESYTFKGFGEYGSISDHENVPSPISSMDNNIIMMIHQLQGDITNILNILQVEQRTNSDTVAANGEGNQNDIFEETLCDQPTRRSNRWAGHVADIQEAQGILRRLRRTNSKPQQNVIV